MVEVASKAEIAWQDELWIGRESSPGSGSYSWTQILGIEELNPPEMAPEDVDVTHMQSPGRTRETIPGLLSSADWSQDKQLWRDDPGDMLLDELATKTEQGDKEMVGIEFVSGGIRRTYRGYVSQFTPKGSVGDKRMVAVALKVFNRLPTNPRSV